MKNLSVVKTTESLITITPYLSVTSERNSKVKKCNYLALERMLITQPTWKLNVDYNFSFHITKSKDVHIFLWRVS